MPWYLPARPQTVVSLVRVGRLPEALPHYIPRVIRFYSSPLEAAKHSTDRMNQTFLIEAELPSAEDSELIVSSQAPDGTLYKETAQFDIQWLKSIFVATVGAQKLLEKLFNVCECPLLIVLNPDFFPKQPLALPLAFLPPPPPSAAPPNFHYVQQGDLLGSRCQTLVNTVNCVGIMGKGIALQFKLRYPEMFKDYEARCRRKEVKPGQPYLYKDASGHFILNFPTKNHWKNPSRLVDIENGLRYLVANWQAWGITSLAIPPLGCGNGGLDWKIVRPLIEQYLVPLPIRVEIYVPFAKAERRLAMKSDRRKDTRAASGISSFFGAVVGGDLPPPQDAAGAAGAAGAGRRNRADQEAIQHDAKRARGRP